jgi:hypothetical protein
MKRQLNIKSLVPRAASKENPYKQGYYKLVNPEKYLGDPTKIIFRSSWEKRFATYCDHEERIIAWSSEPLKIPYLDPVSGETKSYNPDFYVRLKTVEGFQEFLVEVKPSRQLQVPNKPSGRITEKKMVSYNNAMKTYIVNLAKFKAARDYSHGRGWEFIVVTESFIF